MLKKIMIALIEASIIASFLYFAFVLENPNGLRTLILLITSCVLGISIVILQFIPQRYGLFYLCIQLICLTVLEMDSRYAINYFYHILYFVSMLQSILMLKQKGYLIFNSAVVVLSAIKFIQLVMVEPIYFNFAMSTFFITISVFMLIIGLLIKNYALEKSKSEALNSELLTAYRQLRDMDNVHKDAAVLAERNRIAQELHDHLGHQLIGNIMQLEILTSQKDVIDQGTELEMLKSNMREQLRTVRNIVTTLKSETGMSMELVYQIFREFESKTGIVVATQIDEQLLALDLKWMSQIIPIIKEALTNSVKHGQATYVFFEMKMTEQSLCIRIRDNGQCKLPIQYGNGLKGMEERIALLGGALKTTGSVDGFIIDIKINMILENEVIK